MGHWHLVWVKPEAIERALADSPNNPDHVAEEIGRAVVQLTAHNSHENGPLGPASLPFGETAEAIGSAGSIHLSDEAYFTWSDARLTCCGPKGRLITSELQNLLSLERSGRADRYVETLKDASLLPNTNFHEPSPAYTRYGRTRPGTFYVRMSRRRMRP